MKQTPYDTGKVKIGVFYEPPKHPPYMSADAEKLQRALLRRPARQIAADRAEHKAAIKDSLMWTVFMLVMFGLMQSPTVYAFIKGA